MRIKTHTCYFKDLTKYDKRLQPLPGSVLVFNSEKEWEDFISDSAPDTLTNRGHLTVIVYDSFPMGSSISIQNKHGISMLIDEDDLGLLSQHKDGYWCFCINNRGYATISHKKDDGVVRSAKFDRLIMGFPVGLEVDHINKNKLDNRRKNLRNVTPDAWKP